MTVSCFNIILFDVSCFPSTLGSTENFNVINNNKILI